ncbi:MAG TPA: DNA polymerase III subunit delta' [Dongiaceae bacterium]|nr:DNA polymerase III subunit delta' [Dongiaceae bacterium]
MARKPVVAETVEPTGPVVATDLLGHGEAEQSFLRALQRNRMPHAWLITGPRGVGKATLAYRMARRLLSDMPPQTAEPAADSFALFDEAPATKPVHAAAADSLDMPADHPVFRRIIAQSHPDLRVLQRRVNEKTGKLRSEILIDDVRDVLDFLHLKPAESHWRVVVIDAADDLNRNAANAILKMLEEPAARTVLILVSHAPGGLLPTIRSRCRRLALAPLPDDVLQRALSARCPDAEPADLKAAMALAAGSLGQGVTLLDQNGLTVFRLIMNVLQAWPQFSVQQLHQIGDRLASRGSEAEFDLAVQALDWWLKRLCRQLALVAAGSADTTAQSEIFPGEMALIDRCRRAASLDRWIELWEKLNRLFDRVASVNLDRKQAWIAGCLAIEAVGR